MSVGVNRENALSDALGAILLVAVVGMAVAVISAVILSEPVPEKIPALNADITTIGRTILITHNGGDSLEKADMAIIIDGNETKNSFQRIDGTPWSAWAVGDSLYYNVPPGQPMPQGMTIFFVGGSSARIITSMGVPQTVSAGGLYPTGTGTATPTPAPVADFNGTPTSGTVPLTVTFTDLSTRTPTSWNWTFGDIGAGNTSTSQNPSHMYTTAGTYTVTLVASNAGGSDTKTQTGFTVTPPLSGFTVEAWVKWNIDPNPGNDTTRKWATIVVDGTTDNNRRYQLQHDQYNTNEFALSTTNTSGAFVQSNIKPGVGTWYYVTGVYNQTPGTMAIFVNGVQNSSKVVDSSGLRPSPNLYQRGGPAGISYNNNDGRGLVINRIFNGEIWGLNTYERALSPAEIAANFAKGGP
ncbi:MAG: PKD domain-containing protein, partial [Methanoregula sp.]|nr:PKD domain-containing protein [Methanoregula sp.]